MTTMNEVTEVSNQRYLNVSAIKQHALKASDKIRGGKFERVGSEFITEVQIDVENLVRSIQIKYPSKVHADLVFAQVEDKPRFVTGELLEKIQTVLDDAIARLIQRKVESHPGVGKTLQNTR